MNTCHLKIVIYATSTGKAPFSDWLKKLDGSIRALVRTRLDRVSLGNLDDSKILKNGEGIRELRIDCGAGYRIYFGMKDSTIVVLLTGGDKGSQLRDIEKAKRYWLDYNES